MASHRPVLVGALCSVLIGTQTGRAAAWRLTSYAAYGRAIDITREELRGPDGRLLGWRLQEGDRIKGYTADGHLRGWFEHGRTYDASGRLIGQGDLLTAFIVTR